MCSSDLNKNRFIREYEGAIGVKTGYTSKAGHCFVGAAERNDMTLIGVALGAGCNQAAKTRKYTDVKKMISYGFKNFKKYRLVEPGMLAGMVQVIDGKEEQLEVMYNEEIIMPLTAEEKESIKIKISLPETIEAPITQQEVVGEAAFVCGDKVLGTIDVVAQTSIDKATLMDKMKRAVDKWLNK